MMPTRYTSVFKNLSAQKSCAFIPFVVMGDPDFEASLRIIDALVQGGADALELGMPFSDPVADGPSIQNATTRAFATGMNSNRCFDLLETIRAKYPQLPIGLLLYANLVYSQGMEKFYERCAHVGVDSILIADVPLHEYAPFYYAAQQSNMASIFICPPDASDAVIKDIAKYGDAYTYLMSRVGVTGAENPANNPHTTMVKKLVDAGAPPAVQGFGISKPEQVRMLLPSGISGVIAGSAVAELIEQNLDTHNLMLEQIKQFVRDMKVACSCKS